eukprot:m.201416 g.201416  ORF g.201416 m.201416 type:complete len:338 (+) comp39596_c1_seq57:1260-2273(+)
MTLSIVLLMEIHRLISHCFLTTRFCLCRRHLTPPRLIYSLFYLVETTACIAVLPSTKSGNPQRRVFAFPYMVLQCLESKFLIADFFLELPRITLFLPGYPHHCLPEHYSETLECRATGVPLPTVSISNSSGYILTEKEGKADCLLRKTHAREQSYTCWASNQYGNFSKNFTMKICSDESSLTIILEAALPSTLLSIFLLLGIMFGVIRKKYQFNKEEDAFLLDHRDRPFKPSKQLKRLARTIAFVPWKDIARAMEPAIDDSEIETIIEKNKENKEQGAIQFLSVWMSSYPNFDIISSVHEAANVSGHTDLEQKLLKGFPFLTMSESWKKERKRSFVV